MPATLPIRPSPTTTPPALVAVAIAARATGDTALARAAIRELRKTHGIRLTFGRPLAAHVQREATRG